MDEEFPSGPVYRGDMFLGPEIPPQVFPDGVMHFRKVLRGYLPGPGGRAIFDLERTWVPREVVPNTARNDQDDDER